MNYMEAIILFLKPEIVYTCVIKLLYFIEEKVSDVWFNVFIEQNFRVL